MIAADSFVTAHPDLTQRVVTAIVKAAYWSSEEANREALFEIWARSGRPASVYRADFEGQTLKYRDTPLLDDYLIAQYRFQAQQAQAVWPCPQGCQHRWLDRSAVPERAL